MKYAKLAFLLVFSGILLSGCFNDNDDVRRSTSELDIKDFIWKGMNAFYLYKADVSDLANDRFTTNEGYTNFLNSGGTPEAFFNSLLAQSIDDFSWIVSDYVALEQAFDGITRNNGMEFGLVRYPEPNQSLVFGYVRYVLPGTDAETKNLERGMLFNTIDGTQITDQNFSSLLAPGTYTIGLATFDGTDVTPTGQSINLTKTQYTENPVFLAKTLDVDGKSVGYLMYNSFTADFDAQLNAAFSQFKSGGVTELVLDVRYNGGGSVISAIDLSSMITGQFNGEVFTTEEWNEDRQEQFGSINKFDNQIRNGAAINSLGLTRVYILTTGSSASASELVINGLDPYIDVIQVGVATRGKFQASVTLYDSDNFGRQGADPGHTYAMQPLVLKSINSAGVTDYFDGFAPEIEISEDYTNLGIIGDPNEPMLKAALDDIRGTRSIQNYHTITLESIGSSNMYDANNERMYIETPTSSIFR